MEVGKLAVRSCPIDGKAIVCDENGLADFELIRRHGAIASAVHCAFDLLELNGEDLRRQPIEERKWRLANLLDGSHLSLVLNQHCEQDGKLPELHVNRVLARRNELGLSDDRAHP